MRERIEWLRQRIVSAMNLFFGQHSEFTAHNRPRPATGTLLPEHEMTQTEEIILLLALMPHIDPHSLDLFFVRNVELDRPYTEFGGWAATTHSGFLPTGDTAVFIVSGGDPDSWQVRQEVMEVLGNQHWFHKENILSCEGQGEGEPFLSGHLVVSDQVLARAFGTEYVPEYNASFPAKKVDTPRQWDDLVLPYHLHEEIGNILVWLQHGQELGKKWRLERITKPGYRCLFYGPPGTGKTLTAALLGKQAGIDLYRIDLSMIVSKYIGETEKNLAKVFDKAGHHNWILFFDEADALFGKRTGTSSSNDRYANQEVAYLLQRIEEYPGMVILASNLKENIDEAFFRRFQSSLYFPVPDQRLRYLLWQQILPEEWLVGAEDPDNLLHIAAAHALTGGSIVNIVQRCAICIFQQQERVLSEKLLRHCIRRELEKEGNITGNSVI